MLNKCWLVLLFNILFNNFFVVLQFSSVQFSRSGVSDSLRPHESQHARPSCPSPTPGVYSNSCPSSWSLLLLLLLSHFVVSNSVWPHRQQPTRLPRPWDSPGKNTGVGCHFLLQCMKVESESEVAQLCPTLSDPMDCSPPGSSIHGIFQARVLEWGASAFSRVGLQTLAKKKKDQQHAGLLEEKGNLCSFQLLQVRGLSTVVFLDSPAFRAECNHSLC